MGGDLLREIHGLHKNLSKLTNGQAVVDNVEFDPEADEEVIQVVLTPKDGLYRGARTRFEIRVGTMYPSAAPEVTCLNKLYHPNIDLPEFQEFGRGGSVCVNTLGSDWEPGLGLDGCIMSLLFLLYNPNVDDALSPVFDSFLSEEEFADNVRKSLRGQDIDGFIFDKLVEDDVHVSGNKLAEGAKESLGGEELDGLVCGKPTREHIGDGGASPSCDRPDELAKDGVVDEGATPTNCHRPGEPSNDEIFNEGATPSHCQRPDYIEERETNTGACFLPEIDGLTDSAKGAAQATLRGGLTEVPVFFSKRIFVAKWDEGDCVNYILQANVEDGVGVDLVHSMKALFVN